MIRTGIKSIAQIGYCPEEMWPHDPARLTTRPTADCYDNASAHRSISYARIDQDLVAMKACLASGYPFIFGFSVYESFESEPIALTGKVPMPRSDERRIGAHAVLAVGYDDVAREFIVRNSWGAGWGIGGHFFLPYDYLAHDGLSADFWTIRVVT
jgi:C1A family cysteine protease